MEIRTPCLDDVPGLVKLIQNIPFEGAPEELKEYYAISFSADTLSKQLDQHNLGWLVASEKSQIVGAVKWSINSDKASMVWLSQLRVAPKFRGKGVATTLIGNVETLAKTFNLDVGLAVWCNGKVAKLYKGLGYRQFRPKESQWEIDFTDFRKGPEKPFLDELLLMKKQLAQAL